MKIFSNFLSILFICFLFINNSRAATFTSIAGGNFDLPETWDVGGGMTPGAMDDVVIKHNVYVDLMSKKTIKSLSLINDGAIFAGLEIRGTDSLVVSNNVQATSMNSIGNVHLKVIESATFIVNGDCNFLRVTGNVSNAYLTFILENTSKTFINGLLEFDYQGSGSSEGIKEIIVRGSALLDVAGETRFRNSAGHDFNVGLYDDAHVVLRDSLTLMLTGTGAEAGITLHDSSDFQLLASAYVFNSSTACDDFAKLRVREASSNLYIQDNVYLESQGAKVKIQAEGTDGVISVGGDIVMNASVENETILNIIEHGKIELGGNILRQTNFGKLSMADEGALVFNGSNPQTIPQSKLAGSGDDSLFFGKIILENTSLVPMALTEDLIIQDSLILRNGNLQTSDLAKVVLADSATISGSSSAYVEGPVRKLGSTGGQNLTIPIGTSSIYAPITISAITSTSSDVTFRFASEPPPFGVEELGAGVDSVSTNAGSWKIEKNASTGLLDVTLNWEDSNEAGVTDIDDVIVVGWDGTEWVSYGQESAGVEGAGGYVTSIASEPPPFGVEEFMLGFNSSGALLPVELKRFKAIPESGSVYLEWKTVSEINAKVFVVERSTDGVHFETIHFVNSKGAISTPAQYSAKDLSPIFGWNYYRLKMIDNDGSFDYSPIEVVKFKDNGSILAYPNPVREVLHIQDTEWLEDEVRIEIYDRNSTRILEKVIELNRAPFHLAIEGIHEFPSGYYIVKITGKAGSKFVNFVIAE